jgi:hypothetical protein
MDVNIIAVIWYLVFGIVRLCLQPAASGAAFKQLAHPTLTPLQLKEELTEAEGISRIFDDSDKNRNHIGWLGTMAQTYFPRFFTPDDDDDDDDDNDDDDDDDDDDGGGKSDGQANAAQKTAAASGVAAEEKKSA